MAKWRTPVIVALCSNAAVLFVAIVIGGATMGFASLETVGIYAEMDRAGVIDHQRLAQFRSGQFAGDWYKVPEYLIRPFNGLRTVLRGICALAVLNSLAMFILWRRLAACNTAWSAGAVGGSDQRG
jgi:hypothetical protein